MLPEFATLQANDGVAQRIQRNVASALARLIGKNGNPLLDYVRIVEVVLTTVPTPVPHKLGRKPVGWFVTRSDAPAIVYETGATDSRLTLAAASNVMVDLYIF